jgi:hypothetical protein
VADKWDVHDRYGGKVGEIRRTTDWEQTAGDVGGAVATGILALLLAGIIAACAGFIYVLNNSPGGRYPGPKTILLGAFLVIVSYVLPWYKIGPFSVQGADLDKWPALMLIASIAAGFIALLRLARPVYLIGVAGAGLCLFLQLNEFSSGLAIGFYLAGLGICLMAVGSYLDLQRKAT